MGAAEEARKLARGEAIGTGSQKQRQPEPTVSGCTQFASRNQQRGTVLKSATTKGKPMTGKHRATDDTPADRARAEGGRMSEAERAASQDTEERLRTNDWTNTPPRDS